MTSWLGKKPGNGFNFKLFVEWRAVDRHVYACEGGTAWVQQAPTVAEQRRSEIPGTICLRAHSRIASKMKISPLGLLRSKSAVDEL